MKVNIALVRNGIRTTTTYMYEPHNENEKPMVLDVLLQAQSKSLPDLAFRYGCRARNCGVCTVDINGKPRIACRARCREGDLIAPMNTLPVIADLVVRRDGVGRQLIGRLASAKEGEALNREAPDAYHALTACIECYACLEGCPMHQRNFDTQKPADCDPDRLPDSSNGYRWGNPFSLLKLQLQRLDPLSSEADRKDAVSTAVELGLDACVGCDGCKCGVGIDLSRQVISPLLEAAK